ncbi:ABC transporter permease [Ferviditalea candida]|uniref:ABC transporter permease n=1 Tax=Ferviditalea candida TaxID=3108399 RepID=A0ABU5ZDR1_9BACL|nr:ABC transporter permease [Paenibacillaceae bacterium T2]
MNDFKHNSATGRLNSEDFRPLKPGKPIEEQTGRIDPGCRKSAWIRLKSNKKATAALWIMIVVALLSLLGPVMSKYDDATNDLHLTNAAPSSEHWFGTDDLGRDMWARTWKGGRISLFVGIAAALIDLIIGVVYGGVMGFYGGKVDETMNRVSEILYSIPYMLVVVLLLVVMPPGLWTMIAAISMTGWVQMAWIVRGQIMDLKNREFVIASRALGAGSFRLLFRHLLPNAAGPIIATLALTVPSAIFTEAFLSFLGLGVQAPAASWGTMISDARSGFNIYPWRMLFPALLISLTMFAFNAFGDALREAFDPKSR